MAHMVIAAYRPKSGMETQLLELVRSHLPILRAEDLVTDRPSLVLRAKDGTLLEIFEWASQAAVERAHSNPAVLAMWERFGQACDYVTLGDLEESRIPFAHFELVEL